MHDSSPSKVVWVDDNEQFNQLASCWLSSQYLAIDTEFERRTTYFPVLALVQIFDGKSTYLIDPLKVTCPDDFRAVCASDKIVKIMHSAREDLEVFYYSWNCQFKALFDTQLAHGFAHGEVSKGYAALVESVFQITLDKQATQSDWIRRPLSSTQLDYAVNDVVYLPEIYFKLVEKLETLACQPLFKAECEELCETAIKTPDLECDYRLAGDVWRLDGKQLALFKQLYRWRETTAIESDRTKNHIFKDAQLVQIALKQPTSKTSLSKINDIHPRSLRLYGEPVIELVSQFAQTESNWPQPVTNPLDVSGLNALCDRLIKAVKLEAKRLDIVPAILLSKRMAKKMCYAALCQEPMPAAWAGWRGQLFKSQFESLLSAHRDSNCVES